MKETTATVTVALCIVTVIMSIFGLFFAFSGSPDYMDAVICEKLMATPRQCAALIASGSADDTITTTSNSVTSTTRKMPVE